MKISFRQLWKNYPKGRVKDDCNPYRNQCAIRLSVALNSSGLIVKRGYKSKNVCVVGGSTNIRGAETLARHLKNIYRKPLIYKRPSRAKILLKNKKGIIFFKDLKGFRGGIGDHIDLWNGKITKTGEYWEKCKQVWFWELN